MERFGYPDFVRSTADDLIAEQYADRPQLRAILDAVINAAGSCGSVVIQARKTFVSLLTARRTFARVQPTSADTSDAKARRAATATTDTREIRLLVDVARYRVRGSRPACPLARFRPRSEGVSASSSWIKVFSIASRRMISPRRRAAPLSDSCSSTRCTARLIALGLACSRERDASPLVVMRAAVSP